MKATFNNQFIVACIIVTAIAIGGVATDSDALIVVAVIGVIATMLGAFIHIESAPILGGTIEQDLPDFSECYEVEEWKVQQAKKPVEITQ